MIFLTMKVHLDNNDNASESAGTKSNENMSHVMTEVKKDTKVYPKNPSKWSDCDILDTILGNTHQVLCEYQKYCRLAAKHSNYKKEREKVFTELLRIILSKHRDLTQKLELWEIAFLKKTRMIPSVIHYKKNEKANAVYQRKTLCGVFLKRHKWLN